MKYVRLLPFWSELDGEKFECVLWQADENICDVRELADSYCDTSGSFYGTGDEREPKFCARHFYQGIVDGDGFMNYRLVERHDLE
jgi:hypothetical protein